MEQITMVNAAVQPASEQDILGAAAAEYVKLQAKMATLKAQLKELEQRSNALKAVFKSHRTGEMNEVISLKYKKSKYTIAFKDSIRNIMDQEAVRAEYVLLGKPVPMKQSTATSLEVIRA